jgi:hypothetical protein
LSTALQYVIPHDGFVGSIHRDRLSAWLVIVGLEKCSQPRLSWCKVLISCPPERSCCRGREIQNGQVTDRGQWVAVQIVAVYRAFCQRGRAVQLGVDRAGQELRDQLPDGHFPLIVDTEHEQFLHVARLAGMVAVKSLFLSRALCMFSQKQANNGPIKSSTPRMSHRQLKRRQTACQLVKRCMNVLAGWKLAAPSYRRTAMRVQSSIKT